MTSLNKDCITDFNMWYTTFPIHVVMYYPCSYPGCVGEEKWPGINCLHMHDHSQKNLGISLRLKMRTCPTSSKDVAVCQLEYLQLEDNRRVYVDKDAFLRLSTSFSKSVRYKVLSFVWLTLNKTSWIQSGVATLLSCQSRHWYHSQLPNLSARVSIVNKLHLYISIKLVETQHKLHTKTISLPNTNPFFWETWS